MRYLKKKVAIIGAGTAGLSAYRAAKKRTDEVVLIERGPHGTTCARVGCMPSKLLIAAAEAAHMVEKAPAFGVHTQPPRIDGREVMDRVRRERDRFVGFVLESVDDFPEEDKISGSAKFLDAHRLRVDDHTEIEAEAIVIATGSSPVVLPHLKELGDRLIVNDEVFEWQDLPKSVAVLGPGVIGLELGQALHRLGVRVVVLGKGGGVGPLSDPDLIDYGKKVFNREFFVNPDAHVTSITRTGDEVEVIYQDLNGHQRKERFDYLLSAVGRRPNLKDLHLEKTGLFLDERGMPDFDTHSMQSGESHIFIAGDVNNYIPLLHEAADEGRIAGDNAARFPDIRAGLRRTPLGIVFTEPGIATVGYPFSKLRSDCFAIGEVSFEDQGRSRVMLQNKGLMHVYAEHGTGLFMGAEIIGPRAEHLAHLLAWAHQSRMTVMEMLEMPFYHPVIEEGVRTALREVQRKLHFGPEPIPRCLDCGPGS